MKNRFYWKIHTLLTIVIVVLVIFDIGFLFWIGSQ